MLRYVLIYDLEVSFNFYISTIKCGVLFSSARDPLLSTGCLPPDSGTTLFKESRGSTKSLLAFVKVESVGKR